MRQLGRPPDRDGSGRGGPGGDGEYQHLRSALCQQLVPRFLGTGGGNPAWGGRFPGGLMPIPPTPDAKGEERTGGHLIIAIDGPVGAGKSTAARLLAKRLGYRYIDSGAMYRALAWKALQAGLDLGDERSVSRLADTISIAFEPSGDRERILVDGQDVSRQIREREVEQASSLVSTLASVRCGMVARQRDMAAQGGVVMDGRDIGTVVFPDADVKFYLEARLEERAKRRYLEARSAGVAGDLEKFTEEIEIRDARDMGRSASPLRKAEDAVTIDTTGLNTFQVVAAMENETNRRVGPVEGSA